MLPPPDMPQGNPFVVANHAYGVWQTAMTEDPSGTLLTQVAEGAVKTGAMLGVVGYLLPKFSPSEGLKWGALIGAARAAWLWYGRRQVAPPSPPPSPDPSGAENAL